MTKASVAAAAAAASPAGAEIVGATWLLLCSAHAGESTPRCFCIRRRCTATDLGPFPQTQRKSVKAPPCRRAHLLRLQGRTSQRGSFTGPTTGRSCVLRWPKLHRMNSDFLLGPELTHNLHPPRAVGDTSCGRRGGICRTTPNGPRRSYTPSTRRRSSHYPEGAGTGSECWLSRRGRKERTETLTRSSSLGLHRGHSHTRLWMLRVLS